ncbi:hypothetical protein PTTG_06922 [Puccinia triticina 1-1 BBBD Race 1]|uniref:Uncharacterized protein n=1 Tax=Puccinia triticina (isolate 1-1 / race 1 (BBBD)) TaxID=630390 RepID=A0A180GAK2_PUCT1|nr:hypothetical protein PTTG_06922 [Puccinia triticina 1-1 BBBD Race 1]
MPCKSERKKVLEGMEIMLVGSLWKMKMAHQASKVIQLNPTQLLIFNFLLAAGLQLKKLLPNKLHWSTSIWLWSNSIS